MKTGALSKAWEWRAKRFIAWRDGIFARMPAGLRLATRWPWPMAKPWQRPRIVSVCYGGGVGDELMGTAVFREIRRLNPRCEITFLSRYPDLFAGNPHCTVRPRPSDDADLPDDTVWLHYGPVIPPRRSLPEMMGECAGLRLTDLRPEPPRVEPRRELRGVIEAIPRPRIAIQPLTSKWSPNKNWPREHWRALVARLVETHHVIEVGAEPLFDAAECAREFGERFHTFAGKTTVPEFAWIVSQAQLFIGPDSAGIHLAAAYEVPAIAIFGGYQSPAGVPYKSHRSFYTPEPCAPCWLSTGCPFNVACQRKILPATILEAAQALLPRASH